MDFKPTVYEIARRYVRDQYHQGVLDRQDVNLLTGKIRARDLASLASTSDWLPSAYASGDRLKVAKQIEAFFKKNAVFLDEPEAVNSRTRKAFEKAERRCRITNRRLAYWYLNEERFRDKKPDLWIQMLDMVHYIEDVLGEYQNFLEDLPNHIRITGGATATRSRKQSTPFLKLDRRIDCTEHAKPYLEALARLYGYQAPRRFRTLLANRVEVVPKTWKIGRTIACEPTGNLPLQLAFDSYVKLKLRENGINLSDQSRNQQLAKEGSIDGRYATLDLSMASDTLSISAVQWLLPQGWLKFLEDVRSPMYKHRDSEGKTSYTRYAKFSSMGNGATFVLETLIFAAAAFATGSNLNCVYGDDIIVETEHSEKLIALLRFIGFETNPEKSFTEGPFRESCGSDWYEGSCVTPFYLRKWSMSKAILSHNVNGLVAISPPGGEVWWFCKNLVQDHALPLVPFNLSSSTGVWIDASKCYSRKGIIRRKQKGPKGPILPMFRGLVPKTRVQRVYDSRSLFLWFLQKNFRGGTPLVLLPSSVKIEIPITLLLRRERLEDGCSVSVEGSRVTHTERKYVRKWVHWFPPVADTPVHLYRWADFVIFAEDGCPIS